mmetsp:Transcript_12502/g.18659  ORF Transcript_12502/g.18659 Transcript_12502/m.18659 type:complete len:777 (+) Transcript_12502:66-2396(+)
MSAKFALLQNLLLIATAYQWGMLGTYLDSACTQYSHHVLPRVDACIPRMPDGGSYSVINETHTKLYTDQVCTTPSPTIYLETPSNTCVYDSNTELYILSEGLVSYLYHEDYPYVALSHLNYSCEAPWENPYIGDLYYLYQAGKCRYIAPDELSDFTELGSELSSCDETTMYIEAPCGDTNYTYNRTYTGSFLDSCSSMNNEDITTFNLCGDSNVVYLLSEFYVSNEKNIFIYTATGNPSTISPSQHPSIAPTSNPTLAPTPYQWGSWATYLDSSCVQYSHHILSRVGACIPRMGHGGSYSVVNETHAELYEDLYCSGRSSPSIFETPLSTCVYDSNTEKYVISEGVVSYLDHDEYPYVSVSHLNYSCSDAYKNPFLGDLYNLHKADTCRYNEPNGELTNLGSELVSCEGRTMRWEAPCADTVYEYNYTYAQSTTIYSCSSVNYEDFTVFNLCGVEGDVFDLNQYYVSTEKNIFYIPPTASPSLSPSQFPSSSPTYIPTISPASVSPSVSPTLSPSTSPTSNPTASPSTNSPSVTPTATPSSVSPSISPTSSPSTSPTSNPTPSPSSNFPSVTPTTGAPVVVPYSVDITIEDFSIEEVDEEFEEQMANAVAGILGVSENEFYLQFQAGSVIMQVVFIDAASDASSESPFNKASTLASKSSSELSTGLGVNVTTVSAPEPGTNSPTQSPTTISPSTDNASSSSDDADNESKAEIITGVVVGVVGAATLIAILWFFISRQRRDERKFDNDVANLGRPKSNDVVQHGNASSVLAEKSVLV